LISDGQSAFPKALNRTGGSVVARMGDVLKQGEHAAFPDRAARPGAAPQRASVLAFRRRRLLAVGLAALLVSIVPAAPFSLAHANVDAEPKAFIEGLAGQAIAALTPPDLSRGERETRARVLLAENFAVPAIGQFVLGRYWRTATDAERREYLELFEDLIVVTYVDRFSRYSGENLRVTRSVPDPESGDVMVYSEISRPAAKPIEVGWRVRSVGSGFKIVDVFVEGVSMGQTQRSEFSSVIRNGGGKLAVLLEEMRRRVRQEA
jgi:phospholipid transport system substrate-binding protein